MARTVYFKDGTKDVILGGNFEDQITEMACIIRERLGDDAEKLFLDIVNNK